MGNSTLSAQRFFYGTGDIVACILGVLSFRRGMHEEDVALMLDSKNYAVLVQM